jgi:hypothetical protein
MEIDNFSYSHRCTSTVRLWSGARSVCQHRRVPLRHFLRFFRPPLPQKCSVLYFLTCSTSSWVQRRTLSLPRVLARGVEIFFSRIQR